MRTIDVDIGRNASYVRVKDWISHTITQYQFNECDCAYIADSVIGIAVRGGVREVHIDSAAGGYAVADYMRRMLSGTRHDIKVSAFTVIPKRWRGLDGYME